MEEKPRLSRLTEIITQLQSQNLITARQLSEKYCVSVRTIYRDIRTLEKSGIPIVTEEGKGYSLMEGYKLPPVLFTEDEANALITAEKLINKNKDQSFVDQFGQAIVKIKAVLRHSQKRKVNLLSERIYFGENRSNEKTSGYLMRIQSTITNFNVIGIDYLSLTKKATKRDIEPFALYNSQGNWLLIAYCRLRNEFRAFRIDCIQNLVVKDLHFEPHNMTLKQYFEQYIK